MSMLQVLLEQASIRAVALELQQRLLDESDGLFDVSLHPFVEAGVKLIIVGPFATNLIVRVAPLNGELEISVWLVGLVTKGPKIFTADDAGMSKAVGLIIRQLLGSTWTMDQRIVTELFSELRNQKQGLRANGVWYKLKKRTPHPELTVGKLYLVTQKGIDVLLLAR